MSDEKLMLHVAPPKHHVHFFIFTLLLEFPFTLDNTENSHEDTLHVHFTLLVREEV